jgi:hypothetical protein
LPLLSLIVGLCPTPHLPYPGVSITLQRASPADVGEKMGAFFELGHEPTVIGEETT